MRPQRVVANLVVMTALVVSGALPDSWIKDGVRVVCFAYITTEFVLRFIAGYRRRRPHWTRESWRLYSAVCLVPLGALVGLVLMMTALEMRLPIVGASRSPQRSAWAFGSVFFLIVFAGGVVSVAEALHRGDPAEPYSLPWWLTPFRRLRKPPTSGS